MLINMFWYQIIANPDFPEPNTHLNDVYKEAGFMVDENFPKDPKEQAKICDFDENSKKYESPEQC